VCNTKRDKRSEKNTLETTQVQREGTPLFQALTFRVAFGRSLRRHRRRGACAHSRSWRLPRPEPRRGVGMKFMGDLFARAKDRREQFEVLMNGKRSVPAVVRGDEE